MQGGKPSPVAVRTAAAAPWTHQLLPPTRPSPTTTSTPQGHQRCKATRQQVPAPGAPPQQLQSTQGPRRSPAAGQAKATGTAAEEADQGAPPPPQAPAAASAAASLCRPRHSCARRRRHAAPLKGKPIGTTAWRSIRVQTNLKWMLGRFGAALYRRCRMQKGIPFLPPFHYSVKRGCEASR